MNPNNPPATKVDKITDKGESVNKKFDLKNYEDPQYQGSENPGEAGFIPYSDRPRRKKPTEEIIRVLEDEGFIPLGLFDEDDSETNGLTEYDKPVVGTIWRAPNGVEVLIEPAGLNPGKDDQMILYARTEEGGNLKNITRQLGQITMNPKEFLRELKTNFALKYNLLKQGNRKVFYFDTQSATDFPADMER